MELGKMEETQKRLVEMMKREGEIERRFHKRKEKSKRK